MIQATENIDDLVLFVQNKLTYYDSFMASIYLLFQKHPESPVGHIHSTRSRIKDISHIKDKIERKISRGIIINKENVLNEVADIAGIRILHLHKNNFKPIHDFIMKQVEEKEWRLFETPKAYTWDPETRDFFLSIGVQVEFNERYYTSVHYIVKRNADQPWTCEIQVRNLFEEIWGEVDHSINYPHPSSNECCREQIRVLAKLVALGSRLVDSIYSSARHS